MISVKKDLCIGCGLCIKSCPKFVFTVVDKKAVVDDKDCFGCGHCVSVCPTEAVVIDSPKAKIGQKLGSTPTFEEVEKIVHSRRSIRKYKDTPVKDEVFKKLLDLANQTPTASNRQGVGYIVTSPETTKKIEQLAQLAVPNSNDYIKDSVSRKPEGVTLGAPHLIAVYDYIDIGAFNAALASDAIDIAAWTLGLGMCFNGILLNLYLISKEMQQMLAVPEGKRIYMFISIGYPDEKYLRRVIRPDATISFL